LACHTLLYVQKLLTKIILGSLTFGAVFGVTMFAGGTQVNAAESSSAKGRFGQTLTANIANRTLPKDETTDVTVRGKGYNVKTGIYVTFCVVPPKGKKPEHCGSYNPTGINTQAHWISSNPPFYAQILATKFGKGGTFKVTLPIGSTIGDYDCTQVKCGILTRADHTNPDHRKADVIIPITFK
jgi:hypothetical protein